MVQTLLVGAGAEWAAFSSKAFLACSAIRIRGSTPRGKLSPKGWLTRSAACRSMGCSRSDPNARTGLGRLIPDLRARPLPSVPSRVPASSPGLLAGNPPPRLGAPGDDRAAPGVRGKRGPGPRVPEPPGEAQHDHSSRSRSQPPRPAVQLSPPRGATDPAARGPGRRVAAGSPGSGRPGTVRQPRLRGQRAGPGECGGPGQTEPA